MAAAFTRSFFWTRPTFFYDFGASKTDDQQALLILTELKGSKLWKCLGRAHQNPSVDEMFVVQKRGLSDLETQIFGQEKLPVHNSGCPTGPITFLEPQDQAIDET